MATMPDTVTVRLDVSDITDVLGTLSQAFQDCADALLMARDKLDEAHARTEATAPDPVPACSCDGDPSEGVHLPWCAVVVARDASGSAD